MKLKEYFVDVLKTFAVTKPGLDEMVSLFSSISSAWNFRTVESGAGFKSVLTGSPIPIEFSVAFSHLTPPRLRFTADFGIVADSAELAASRIAETYRSASRQFLKEELPKEVDSALSILHTNFRHDSPEWFPVGLGGELGGDALTALKLYFRTGPITRNNSVSEALLTLAPEPADVCQDSHTRSSRDELMGSAWAFAVDVLKRRFETKVYSRFWKRGTTGVLNFVGSSDITKSLTLPNLEFTQNREGYVDVCYRYDHAKRDFHVSKLYFFCKDFFPNDVAVLNWLQNELGEPSENAQFIGCVRRIVTMHLNGAYRVLTVVGVGAKSITIYFMPQGHSKRQKACAENQFLGGKRGH